MLSMLHLKEALRIYRRARNIHKTGFHRYSGNAEEICRQIVKKNFNGTYFQVSQGNFPEFYIRDFAICTESLMSLGYKKEVNRTLQYALSVYSSHDMLTTTITKDNRPLHVYSYSPDSLPLLLLSLRIAKAYELVDIYRPFIEQQVDHYYDKIMDRETGLVRAGKLSSMKDNHHRESSCYDNCMMAMMSNELDQLGLVNPFRGHDIAGSIKESFWNRSYFYDDLKKQEYVAGDANTFPFWCNVFSSKSMLKKSISSMQDAGLDMPFPLRYTSRPVKSGIIFPLNILLPDYEADTIWMHLGLCFLDVVSRHNKRLFKSYLAKYTRLIEQHRNFLELFNADGTAFLRSIYAADESMLWASKYIYLKGLV